MDLKGDPKLIIARNVVLRNCDIITLDGFERARESIEKLTIYNAKALNNVEVLNLHEFPRLRSIFI